MDQYDDSIPRARAGHCSVAVSLKRCFSCAFFIWLMDCNEMQSNNAVISKLSINTTVLRHYHLPVPSVAHPSHA